MRKSFASTRWTVNDVLHMKPEWTRKQASIFLEIIESRVLDKMIAIGWEAIDQLKDDPWVLENMQSMERRK